MRGGGSLEATFATFGGNSQLAKSNNLMEYHQITTET